MALKSSLQKVRAQYCRMRGNGHWWDAGARRWLRGALWRTGWSTLLGAGFHASAAGGQAGVCRGLKGASQKRTLGRERAGMGVDHRGHMVLLGESKNWKAVRGEIRTHASRGGYSLKAVP